MRVDRSARLAATLLGGADVGSVGNDATIWRSTNDGESGSKRFQSGQPSDQVVDIEFADGGVVIAAYEGFSEAQTDGVVRFVNDGLYRQPWRWFRIRIGADTRPAAASDSTRRLSKFASGPNLCSWI